jgi:nonsense-mediated mRNA decay protein 3
MMEVEAPPAGGLQTHAAAAICCMCGISIDPNPTHMCLQCLRTQVSHPW